MVGLLSKGRSSSGEEKKKGGSTRSCSPKKKKSGSRMYRVKESDNNASLQFSDLWGGGSSSEVGNGSSNEILRDAMGQQISPTFVDLFSSSQSSSYQSQNKLNKSFSRIQEKRAKGNDDDDQSVQSNFSNMYESCTDMNSSFLSSTMNLEADAERTKRRQDRLEMLKKDNESDMLGEMDKMNAEFEKEVNMLKLMSFKKKEKKEKKQEKKDKKDKEKQEKKDKKDKEKEQKKEKKQKKDIEKLEKKQKKAVEALEKEKNKLEGGVNNNTGSNTEPRTSSISRGGSILMKKIRPSFLHKGGGGKDTSSTTTKSKGLLGDHSLEEQDEDISRGSILGPLKMSRPSFLNKGGGKDKNNKKSKGLLGDHSLEEQNEDDDEFDLTDSVVIGSKKFGSSSLSMLSDDNGVNDVAPFGNDRSNASADNKSTRSTENNRSQSRRRDLSRFKTSSNRSLKSSNRSLMSSNRSLMSSNRSLKVDDDGLKESFHSTTSTRGSSSRRDRDRRRLPASRSSRSLSPATTSQASGKKKNGTASSSSRRPSSSSISLYSLYDNTDEEEDDDNNDVAPFSASFGEGDFTKDFDDPFGNDPATPDHEWVPLQDDNGSKESADVRTSRRHRRTGSTKSLSRTRSKKNGIKSSSPSSRGGGGGGGGDSTKKKNRRYSRSWSPKPSSPSSLSGFFDDKSNSMTDQLVTGREGVQNDDVSVRSGRSTASRRQNRSKKSGRSLSPHRLRPDEKENPAQKATSRRRVSDVLEESDARNTTASKTSRRNNRRAGSSRSLSPTPASSKKSDSMSSKKKKQRKSTRSLSPTPPPASFSSSFSRYDKSDGDIVSLFSDSFHQRDGPKEEEDTSRRPRRCKTSEDISVASHRTEASTKSRSSSKKSLSALLSPRRCNTSEDGSVSSKRSRASRASRASAISLNTGRIISTSEWLTRRKERGQPKRDKEDVGSSKKSCKKEKEEDDQLRRPSGIIKRVSDGIAELFQGGKTSKKDVEEKQDNEQISNEKPLVQPEERQENGDDKDHCCNDDDDDDDKRPSFIKRDSNGFSGLFQLADNNNNVEEIQDSDQILKEDPQEQHEEKQEGGEGNDHDNEVDDDHDNGAKRPSNVERRLQMGNDGNDHEESKPMMDWEQYKNKTEDNDDNNDSNDYEESKQMMDENAWERYKNMEEDNDDNKHLPDDQAAAADDVVDVDGRPSFIKCESNGFAGMLELANNTDNDLEEAQDNNPMSKGKPLKHHKDKQEVGDDNDHDGGVDEEEDQDNQQLMKEKHLEQPGEKQEEGDDANHDDDEDKEEVQNDQQLTKEKPLEQPHEKQEEGDDANHDEDEEEVQNDQQLMKEKPLEQHTEKQEDNGFAEPLPMANKSNNNNDEENKQTTTEKAVEQHKKQEEDDDDNDHSPNNYADNDVDQRPSFIKCENNAFAGIFEVST